MFLYSSLSPFEYDRHKEKSISLFSAEVEGEAQIKWKTLCGRSTEVREMRLTDPLISGTKKNKNDGGEREKKDCYV